MPDLIPTYHLRTFARYQGLAAEVYCPPARLVGEKPPANIAVPYRSDYYKLSLCLRGTAELQVNLRPYAITPGCLVLVTPHIVKQWTQFSADYETLCVFFTSDFLTTDNAQVGKLRFLRSPTTYVQPLTSPEAEAVAASFRFLQQKYHAPHPHRTDIVKNIINGLLFEIAGLFDQSAASPPGTHPSGQALAAAFKHLVQAQCTHARRVAFYADQLCVTPKHLTHLVRAVTGKPASDFIAEAVVLEAQALLQTTTLPMAEVADRLHFTDQFAFSRFFKQRTGLSPTAYKAGLTPAAI
jgi:AraC family transcriptional activator of pobA